MAFNLDFVGDATRILQARLIALGYTVPTPFSEESIRLLYFKVKHRLIPPRPRTIHRAKGFACPLDHQAGLAVVEGKIANGEDLLPHMSKNILKADYSDPALNDWGVHHLHLGTAIAGRGLVGRTGPVLFARFTDTDAYLVGVKMHGQKAPLVWSDQDILRAIHANWPESIERYRIPVRGGLPPTDADIASARRHGCVALIELGGAVYAPIGGGYATDGTASRVVSRSDAFLDHLHAAERDTRALEPRLRAAAALAQVPVPDPVDVVLQRRPTGQVVAVVGDDINEIPLQGLRL